MIKRPCRESQIVECRRTIRITNKLLPKPVAKVTGKTNSRSAIAHGIMQPRMLAKRIVVRRRGGTIGPRWRRRRSRWRHAVG